MLGVLDGVVLVVSAVEGVQAQTLVLMRALQRLRIPTVFFVNKTDRAGADVERVLEEIRTRLGVHPVPLWKLDVEQLAEHDDRLLAAYLDGEDVDVAKTLADLTRRAVVQPALHGSTALTGEGVEELRAAITRNLPTSSGDTDFAGRRRVQDRPRCERGEGGLDAPCSREPCACATASATRR